MRFSEGLRLETGISGGGAGEKRPSQLWPRGVPVNIDKFVRGVEPPGVFIPFKCLLALIARDSAVGVLKPGVIKLVMGKKRPGGGVKPPAGGLAKEGVWELTVAPGVRIRDVVTGVVERDGCDGCLTTAHPVAGLA